MIKKTTVFILYIFVIILSDFSLNISNSYTSLKSDYNVFLSKKSGSLHPKIAPIFINDSDPLNNWDKIASENEWCSGSGTGGNPFRIENVTIDGLGKGCCIRIINSYVHFEIKNCVLYNASSGIYLENAHNGSLFNNTCFHNNRGITCYDILGICTNISIVRNKLYRNNAGISLVENFLTSITNNKIFENIDYGIELRNTINTIIEENDIYDNSEIGIFLGDCINIYIEKNIISKNYGIYGAIFDTWSENCTYIGNIIQDNLGGIFIGESSNIVVFRNLFLKNTGWGLNATFCHSNNFAYLNCFVSNGNNAQDVGLSFEWDNGTIGNYWSDYRGKDSDENGIGDTPYYIQGLPDVPDNYPLMSCPFYTPENKIIYGYDIPVLLIGTIMLSIIIIIKKKERIKKFSHKN